MWDLMTLYDQQKKLAEDHAVKQKRKQVQKEMKMFYDVQVESKAQKNQSVALMERMQRKNIDKQVEVHNEHQAIRANDKRIERLQNAHANKELDHIQRHLFDHQQTTRTIQTSPLMKFGASTKKEDVAKARALKIQENEKTRQMQLQAIKVKTNKIEENKEKDLEHEKEIVQKQLKVIDARKINGEIKIKNFQDKASKLNNFFNENKDILHHSKYVKTQEE